MTDVTTDGAPSPGHDRIEPVDLQIEMQRSLPRLRDVGHRRPRAARRARRPEAGAPPRALRDVRRRLPARPRATPSAPASSATSWVSYHPHGDSAIYDALVRLAQPWSMRYPLVDGQGNFGSPGNDPAAAMRYTECRMAPLAMEMVRDIDEETVDFRPNYDGRSAGAGRPAGALPEPAGQRLRRHRGRHGHQHPAAQPARGRRRASSGPWTTRRPSDEELLEALIERIKGPDFPTGALIVGRQGIEDAYRTGRGSITMRAVVEVEEIQGRTCLVVTELPYQVNPDNLALEDRRAGQGRQGRRHRRHPRRDLLAHRPAPGHRAEARRGRQGRAEQPVQAHPAAGQLRRQHAGAGRRRAAHAVARRVHPALGRRTRSRSSSGAPGSGCARPRSARTSCAACSRRSTRSTRSSR